MDEAIAGIISATNFAAIKHKSQTRKDPEKTPYINHPIGVAYQIVNIGKVYDVATIQAAILHDTVEDTDCTLEEIERYFGKEVRDLVDEVSDDKNLEKMERKRLQIVNAPKKSYKAKLVKLSDKLYNLRDLERTKPEGWSDERRKEYFIWAQKVVDGMCSTGVVNEFLEKELAEIFNRNFVYCSVVL